MMSVNALLSHLWQSTLFAAAVALLTIALRKNQAHWRCRLWLAASLKFLIPFALLAALGSQLGWRSARLAPAGLTTFVDEVTQTIAPPVVHQGGAQASPINLPALLLLLWFAGFATVLFRWLRNWTRVRAAARAATAIADGREWQALRRIERFAGLHAPVALLASKARLEPGVFGVFRTVLLWPAGISDHLDGAQLDAILAHEVCHVRRRDNLTAALHGIVEAVFWFHPLVWWLGVRLVDERERACDEEVLRMGSDPEVYAESILKTCRYFLESPRLCMAGVTGSDLKQRIERIMARRMGRQLDLRRKLLLAAAAIAAVAAPVIFGVAGAPDVRAQSQPAASAKAPAFEVASIKPSNSGDDRTMFRITPGGRVECTNISPKMLIMMAYSLKPNQLSGGPSWIDSTKYDLSAKAEDNADPDQLKLMMRTLLADRFQLAIHRETKEMAIYELVAAKGGHKLQPSPESGEQRKGQFRIGRGEINLTGATLAQFADNLSRVVGRNVYDKTGITGEYDIKLEWTPEENETPDTTGPSLFSAVQEQLGLKLESAKGPVEMVVIDRMEKASEN